MKTRDYSSFAKLAGRLMKPIAADLGFERITDISYARIHGDVAHLIGLQHTSSGGDWFYVNYGVSLPRLGAPWTEATPLKELGLMIDERLHNPEKGQGYECSSKADVERSLNLVHEDLKQLAVPWLAGFITLDQVAAEYHYRWDLQPLGKNVFMKRLGVMQYAYIEALRGDRESARKWFSEAKSLMTDEIDEGDRKEIASRLKDLEA